MNLEIDLTYRCNASCEWCNRAVDLIQIRNMDMRAETISKALHAINVSGIKVKRVFIVGGEPTLHPDLQAIVEMLDNGLPHLGTGNLVATNGLKHDLPSLPNGWRYQVVGLMDPDDNKSGKTSHVPWFISPADFGFEAKHSKCRIRRRCGIGLDDNGFSMCSLAPVYGRLLGINPYFATPHEQEEPKGICEHCVGGLTSREFKRLRKVAPPVSKRFLEAVESYRKQPVNFPAAI